jgi:4'-phosphopantetheinyl transferase
MGEVHIWRIDLDTPALPVESLAASLSTTEHERAAKFRSAQHRERWIVARGAMRQILARYAGIEPAALVFETEQLGKPRLALPEPEIPFNLTHTAGLALLAIAAGGRIGVDAEFIRPLSDLRQLAERFFSSTEAGEILSMDEGLQPAAFFACWTRKEAFLKALGKGLHAPLDQFAVNVKPDEPPRLISVDWQEPSDWYLSDLSEQNLAATVAIDTPISRVERFSFADLASS